MSPIGTPRLGSLWVEDEALVRLATREDPPRLGSEPRPEKPMLRRRSSSSLSYTDHFVNQQGNRCNARQPEFARVRRHAVTPRRALCRESGMTRLATLRGRRRISASKPRSRFLNQADVRDNGTNLAPRKFEFRLVRCRRYSAFGKRFF
jgi:hypothetical protein